MITDAILELVGAVVAGVLGALPSTPAAPDLAGSVSAALEPVEGWIGAANQWFPLDTLAAALVVLVGFAGAVFGLRLLAWVLCLLHVAGTDA